MPPLILQAQKAFYRDLPQLVNERQGQWIAYHGNRRVGFAPTDGALYEECRRRAIPENEYLVFCIEPEAGELVLGVPS